MVVIVIHRDLELTLISSQKKLIAEIYNSSRDLIPYSALPLWINTDFTSPKDAQGQIKKITILQPQYDKKSGEIFCPVKVQTADTIKDFSLSFIKFYKNASLKSIQSDADKTFPLEVKIFRLGECISPNPGVFELSNTIWKKL